MEGKNTEVTIQDMIDYLSKFNPNTKIYLDKDGWMAEFTPHKDAQDLIEQRGLFYKPDNTDYIIINN